MKTLRIGVVGAGANTLAMHLPKLQAIEGIEIVGVSNRTRESSERVAAQFGIPSVYESWRELVEAPDTDAVVIGTWPYMHCPVTLAALHAGKHVLCEARMAMNLAEARAMRDAARMRPQLVAQVVPAPHTLAVDATVRRLLAERYLGDLLAIEVRDGGRFLDQDAALHWRQDIDLSGYNIMSLGIWYESLMRWVGEATRVFAMGRVFVRQRCDAEGRLQAVRVPEHVDVVAEMACGAQAHIQISAVAGFAEGQGITLYGSEATLRFAGGRLLGGRRGDEAMFEISIPDEERGGWRVEEEFVGAIRGHEQVRLTSFDTGVKYMAFTEAVAHSMASGAAVPVAG